MTELILLAVAVLMFPFFAYYTVKFVTFAFYRGRFLAEQFNKEESENHGKP